MSAYLDYLAGGDDGYTGNSAGGAATPSDKKGASIDWNDVAKTGAGLYGSYLQTQAGKDAVARGLSMQATAEDTVKAALARIYDLTPPNLAEIAKPLQQQVFLGKMTPEQYVAALQKESELKGIKTDPQLVASQYDALNQFKEIADSKGLTAADRAQLAEISAQQGAAARGARQALLQNAQERGIAGSGLDLASQMSANQGAAANAASQGNQVAIAAQQRALQALQSQANLAGSMQSNSFNQQAQVAQGQDAVNRYNTSLVNTANAGNVDNRNKAAQDALDKQYQVNRDNATLQKDSQQQQIDATSNQFKNALSQGQVGANLSGDWAKALGLNGQGTAAAGAVQQANGTSNTVNNAAKAVGTAKTIYDVGDKAGWWSAIGDWFSDERLKEEIEPAEADEQDIQELLDKLTGYKYSYKPKVQAQMGKEQYTGIMAQDAEKSPLGESMVEDTSKGKMIDGKKATEIALLALQQLNARLDKLEGK